MNSTPLHFSLTPNQREYLEEWLDQQGHRQIPEHFTVAFTVTPHGVQIRAYLDSNDTIKMQHEIEGSTEECYIQFVEDVGGFFLTPQDGFQNVKLWASCEGQCDADNPTTKNEPVRAYAWLRDDPERTLIPIAASETRYGKRRIDIGDELTAHPLSLYRKYEGISADEQSWMKNYLRWHRNSYEDHWFGRIDSGDLCERHCQVKKQIPDGIQNPLAKKHWRYIEQLNACLLEAEQFARNHDTGNQESTDISFKLICWLREDDPDWSDTTDNVVYVNKNISVVKPMEDWNTFRGWKYDPLGGQTCCYFMHDLIDNGGLRTRDLLRIGSVSIHAVSIIMGEFCVKD